MSAFTVILGRDASTGQLSATMAATSQTRLLGAPGSVPQSVSRQHLQLEFATDGTITARNLKPANVTYVGGMPIVTKQVSKTDVVELGADRYRLNWSLLDPVLPHTADIRPLKRVYDTNHKAELDMQVSERIFNVLQRVTGIFTLSAIVCGILWHNSPLLIVLYALAIVVSVSFFIIAYHKAKEIPHKRDALNNKFRHDYVCPHCGRFLGNTPYDELQRVGSCPYCRTQFHG